MTICTINMMSLRLLGPELTAVAAKELNEEPSRIPTDIEAIRQWLKQQPHLSDIQISNQRILAFLRGCKFSLEKCKQKLDLYYTMKNLAPELLSNRDPMDPRIQEILKSGVALPFLGLAGPAAERVYMIRLGSFDSSKYNLVDVLKTSFMITDILLQEDDNYVISGHLILVDFKNISFGVFAQFTSSLAKKVSICLEKSYPNRHKGDHMINTPTGFETGFHLFKSVLSDKLKKRVHVHNQDMDSLYKFIPKHLLPKDMGGDGETIQQLTDYWKKKVESYRDWFLEEDKYKSDEKKRPGKPKTSEELFGIQGSFRQLNID